MAKHKILIIPSSDHEQYFEKVVTYKTAKRKAKQLDVIHTEFSFDTQAELDAFTKGYNSGIGYLGEGVCFIETVKGKSPSKQELQRQEIRTLLDAMCRLQDALPADISEKEHGYLNDAYDEVKVGFLKEQPDGDYQIDLRQQNFSMSYIQAKRTIIDRTMKMLEDVDSVICMKKAA